MTRRPLSHPAHFYRGLGFLLLLLLLAAGCASSAGPGRQPGPSPGLIPQVEAAPSLKEAQQLFNEAGGLDQPALDIPAASLEKYKQVVDTIETKVLGKAAKPLEVNAYALLAFSQWRLRAYAKAMEAGSKGRQIYETGNLSTNLRDYGMCLMVGGLCLASQTYQEYKNLPGPPTKDQAQNLTGRLQQAMQAIDSVNSHVDRREDIAVYANQWQLALVDAAVRIWTSGLPREVWQPEVCRWLKRAEPVLAKFPDTAYARQSLTLTYKNKFERLKKAECGGQ
jgi:hypothetical protein